MKKLLFVVLALVLCTTLVAAQRPTWPSTTSALRQTVPTCTSTPTPSTVLLPTATPTATSTPMPTPTSTPVPVEEHFTYLPLALRSYPPTSTPTPLPTATPTPAPTTTPTSTPTPTPTPARRGWVTLTGEDFEGSSPGSWWVGSDYGKYYWGKRACRSYAGGYSGWAIGDGTDGTSLGCGSNYPNNANSWMIYGPFSLADATAGDLRFKLWLNSESYYDRLCYVASIDRANFYGTCVSGYSSGWISRVLDLTDVYRLGNLTGRSQVWIALVFTSDSSFNYPEGAYVDNLVLRKYVSMTAFQGRDAYIDPTSDQLQEADWMITAPKR